MIIVRKSIFNDKKFFVSDEGSRKKLEMILGEKSTEINVIVTYYIGSPMTMGHNVSILEYLQIKEFIENTGKTCDQLYDEHIEKMERIAYEHFRTI